jgi:hypothetical protein
MKSVAMASVLALVQVALLPYTPALADEPSAAAAEAAIPENGADLLDALRAHCGKAYAGRVVIDTPATPDSPFAGKPLIMHVRTCARDEIRIPLHVGDDRSRTWVLNARNRLRLKHDHRHADGTPDAVTMYGGDLAPAAMTTVVDGRRRVEFPVDAESIASFEANGRSASVRNTWAIEWSEDRFVYELSRPDGRLFRIEFDLTAPVPAPPPPWGALP